MAIELAARVRRVGRDRVEAADAARRQNYGAGGEVLVDFLAGGAGAHEADALDTAIDDDQVVRLVAFEHADRRRRPHLGDQRVENGGAGAVAGNVHDAATRVRGLLAQRKAAVGLAVERHAVGDKIGNARRAFGGDEVRYVDVDDASTGGDRVVRVRSGIIVAADGGGDAALRPTGRGALSERRGGQHGDRQRRQLQRREQAGETRTDDDHIAVGAEALVGRRAEAAVVRGGEFMCHQIPRRGLHRPAGGSLRRRVFSW